MDASPCRGGKNALYYWEEHGKACPTQVTSQGSLWLGKRKMKITLCILIAAGTLLDPDHKKCLTTQGREGSLKDVRYSDTDLPKNGPGSRQQWIVPPSTVRVATAQYKQQPSSSGKWTKAWRESLSEALVHREDLKLRVELERCEKSFSKPVLTTSTR